jgi:hypothetical protein
MVEGIDFTLSQVIITALSLSLSHTHTHTHTHTHICKEAVVSLHEFGKHLNYAVVEVREQISQQKIFLSREREKKFQARNTRTYETHNRVARWFIFKQKKSQFGYILEAWNRKCFFFVASTFRLSPLILEEHNPDSFGILFYAWSRAFANLTEAGCSGTP